MTENSTVLTQADVDAIRTLVELGRELAGIKGKSDPRKLDRIASAISQAEGFLAMNAGYVQPNDSST